MRSTKDSAHAHSLVSGGCSGCALDYDFAIFAYVIFWLAIMSSAIDCGYVRTAFIEAGKITAAGDSSTRGWRRYNTYLEIIGEGALQMPERDFNNSWRKISEKFKAWDKKSQSARDERSAYLAFFSAKKWQGLSDSERLIR